MRQKDERLKPHHQLIIFNETRQSASCQCTITASS